MHGRSPRTRRRILSITSRSAPTSGARSILLITSRSDRVCRAPFAGDLIAGGDVDDVERKVGQLRRRSRRDYPRRIL